MRNFIDIVEARKPKQAPEPVDLHALLSKLTGIARQYTGHPFDFAWDFNVAQTVKKNVAQHMSNHAATVVDDGDEPLAPLDEREIWPEYLPQAWRSITMTTAAAVSEIKHEESAYQKRHGDRMDAERGRDPMNFVETSDWLTTMKMQERAAVAFSHTTVATPHDIAKVVDMLGQFAQAWREGHNIDDEPILAPSLQEGITSAIPLLMLALKKMA